MRWSTLFGVIAITATMASFGSAVTVLALGSNSSGGGVQCNCGAGCKCDGICLCGTKK